MFGAKDPSNPLKNEKDIILNMFGAKDLSNPLRNENDIILNAFDAKNPGKPSETLESYNSERI